jgi:hypothetical protein
MVKQTIFSMGTFFTRERFGRPQIFAGLLLLIFLAECLWLVAHQPASAISDEEFGRIQEGLEQWQGHAIAGTPASTSRRGEGDGTPTRSIRYNPDHSPIWYLLPSAPIFVFRPAANSALWVWLTRMPYVIIGALLGASVWYVSRRLYGNAGGYVALGLYCFSPSVIRASALWFTQPNIAGSWGTFGALFTAIAVSHTLYAPRKVVLWNWRRTLLLGVSIALAVGSQFGLGIIVPVLLVFMLYLAPQRKLAAMAILAAAGGIAVLLLFSSYFFHAVVFVEALRHGRFLVFNKGALVVAGAYAQLLKELAAGGPVLAMLVPVGLMTYVLWRRTRYFGNTAPLLVALLFTFLRVVAPHDPESVYSLAAVIFLFVFVAGITADLLESKRGELITSVVAGLLAANAIWNLVVLTEISTVR